MKNGIPVLAIALLFLAPSVHADTIYSNLGSGSTYNGSVTYSVYGVQSLAMSFTVPPGPGFNLSQLDIALTFGGGPGNSALVEILTNSGGLPGTVIPLATWTLTNLPFISSHVSSIQPSQTISGISSIVLSGGMQYWLVALPGTPNSFDEWNLNSTSQNAIFAFSSDGGTTWANFTAAGAHGAFDVQGSPLAPVPEPSTVLLVGVGLLGLFALSRR